MASITSQTFGLVADRINARIVEIDPLALAGGSCWSDFLSDVMNGITADVTHSSTGPSVVVM